MKNIQQIKFYSNPFCFQCGVQKKWMKDHGITFIEKSTFEPENLQELTALGVNATPFTLIKFENGDTEKILGFNEKLLKRKIGIER